MSADDARARSRWGCEATVDRGDHGMGMRRADPARVGWIEVAGRGADATLRWAPRHGAGWDIPVSELTVTGPMRWPAGADGTEVRHAAHGTMRVRPLGGARPARRLARELRRRGARA